MRRGEKDFSSTFHWPPSLEPSIGHQAQEPSPSPSIGHRAQEPSLSPSIGHQAWGLPLSSLSFSLNDELGWLVRSFFFPREIASNSIGKGTSFYKLLEEEKDDQPW